jgi:hypothetical protein
VQSSASIAFFVGFLGAFAGTAAPTEADLRTLRLADELDDVCGNALALHGNAGEDDIGLRGGYPWRRVWSRRHG